MTATQAIHHTFMDQVGLEVVESITLKADLIEAVGGFSAQSYPLALDG